MIYFQTIFVYLSLTFVCVWLCRQARIKDNNIWIYLMILIYSIVFGLRYGVGYDFFSYLNAYETLQKWWNNDIIDRFEIGFAAIMRLLTKLNCDSSVFFGVVAFLQLFFSILAFRHEKRLLQCIIFVFILGGTAITYANGLRQVLAVGLWIFSVRYIVERRPVIHYAILLIAFTMHKSAILLFVMYPLLNMRKEWFSNIKFQLIALAVSLILMRINIIQLFLSKFDRIITLTGYNNYIENQSEYLEGDVSLGIGFLCILLTNIIIILFSNRIKGFFNDDYIRKLYDLYFIGVILNYTFIDSMLIKRGNYYFSNISFIMIGIALCYGFYKNRALFWSLILLTFLSFVGIIYKAETNTALFVFNWQKEYFHYKNFINQ